MFRKILVAVDGSPTSDKALQAAADLAADGAQLKVVTVADNPAQLLGVPDDVIYYKIDGLREAALEQAQAVLKGAQLQLGERDIPAEILLVDQTTSLDTSVANGVLAAADAFAADVIVVGTHGRRGVRRFLLGSVAEQIIRTSRRPVLTIRQAGDAGSARQRSEETFAEWPEANPIGN